MFEGFSFFQYDTYVRRDPKMQKIILRDQTLILLDKVNSLKNNVSDKGLINTVKITFIS
jgi:hypothetical protein